MNNAADLLYPHRVPTAPRPSLYPPPIVFNGRVRSSAEVAATAAGWLDVVRDAIPRGARLTAMLMSNHPDAVALLFALSTLPLPVVVFPADPRAWRTDPPLPPGTPVFVPPALRAAARASADLDLRALPDPRPGAAASGFLACPGFVNFTSGSTGLPKPVYIATASFLTQAAAVVEAGRLEAGGPIVGSLPLSTHYGFGQALLLAAVLGAPLGLLERFDHRGLLRLLADGPYAYWPTTPLMADQLARAPLTAGCPAAPAVCHVSAGRLSPQTSRTFAERFGVALRPSYGQTENGFITVDAGATGTIRLDRVGRAAPGIAVRVGDDPLDPHPPERPGRVWYTSPWYMEGYGFPPELAPREGRQGWWPTADVGVLDDEGYLALAGRLDDCFKTARGHLVNPGLVADALAGHPGVTDVVVIPLRRSDGPELGAVVESESEDPLEPHALRATAARVLPPWLQPGVVTVVRRLPRLAGGKADREACHALLLRARGIPPAAG